MSYDVLSMWSGFLQFMECNCESASCCVFADQSAFMQQLADSQLHSTWLLLNHFQRDVVVRIDVDAAGDLQRFADDRFGIQFGIRDQGARGG
jgi:hypothetical protein